MKRLASVLMLLLLVGCAGPQVPLRITGKSVPIDVAFGPNGALPPVRVQPVPGGFIVIPPTIPPEELPPIHVPPPTPPPRPCPEPGPFAFPKKPATDEIFEPPVGAQYRFRFSGSRTIDGETTDVAPHGLRTVGNIKIENSPTSDLRYDVSEVAGTEVTISSYQVTSRGLELTAVQRIVAGTTTRFEPAPPIVLMQMPPSQTDPLGRRVNSWSSAGTDAVNRTTMVVTGELVGNGKQRVDACGERVDSWLAELSVRTVGPGEDTTATWRINVATQYGGILVQEVLNVTGTKGGKPYEESRKAIISEVPRG